MAARGKRKRISEEEEVLNESLLHFINSFGKQFATCISCHNDLESKSSSIFDSVISRRILKDVCIKSIVPPDGTFEDYGDQEDSEFFPFCQECTELVTDLTNLYRQLQSIQEEYDTVRGRFARGIIKTFVNDRDHDESNIFNRWQMSMGISIHHFNTAGEDKIPKKEETTSTETSPFDLPHEELVEIKAEIDEDNLSHDEPGDFIIPEPLSPADNIVLNPFIQLERLTPDESKGSQEPFEYDSMQSNDYAYQNEDSRPDASDSDDCDSDEGKNKEDIQHLEDEYVPPYDLNIPKYGVLTRTRAKSAVIQNHNNDTSFIDESDEVENDPSTDSEAEQITVTRVKRKYTPRNTGPDSKKNKKSKSTAVTNSNKQDGEESGTDNATSVIKPKKKRIRKPVPSVQCTVCNKTITNKSNLTIHMRVHTGEKPFKCSLCEMSFYKPSNLTSHMLKHTKEKPEACDLCDTRCQSKAALRGHKATQHEVFERDILFQCEFCLKKFLTQGALNDHVKRGHKPASEASNIIRNIHCSICAISFETMDALRDHESTEEHSTAKIPTKTSSQTDQIDKPPNIKLPQKKNKLNFGRLGKLCDECDVAFPDRRLYLMHRKKCHPTRDFQCEICGKSFTEIGNLRKHIRGHSAGKDYICNVCGHAFKHQISLKLHSTKHTGEGLFSCMYCSKGFNGPRPYRKHLVEAHAEDHLKEKPCICKCCYLNFESEQTLSEHMSSHDNTKCEYCGKYFPMRIQLTNHLRLHTGEKPFKCSLCSKSFSQETNLKEHEHRHQGTRPYKCIYCDAGFLRKKEMQKHIDKSHQEDVTSQSSSSTSNQLQLNESVVSVDSQYFPTFALLT